MLDGIVKNDDAIADAIAKLTNLSAEIDEIDVVLNKLDGDKGDVHTALIAGEAELETLKAEMKELFQATIGFINGVTTLFDNRDEEASREIQALSQ